MTELSFSDITLDIDDLPSRAAALGEEQTDDILGGWGWRVRLRRGRKGSRGRARRRASSRRRNTRRPPRRRARRSPARRNRRAGFMRKAAFHDRMASRYRSMARG